MLCEHGQLRCANARFLYVHSLVILRFPAVICSCEGSCREEASEDVTIIMAILRALVSLAWILGPVMASFTIYRFSYTGLFLVVSFMYMLVAIFVLVIRVHEIREPSNEAEPLTDSRRSFKHLLMAPQVVFSLLAFMAFELANTMGQSLLLCMSHRSWMEENWTSD